MPSKVQQQVNNFIAGLITEANQISMPESASLDEVNMQLLRDGSRRRRLGLDIEAGGGTLTTGMTAAQLTSARHTFFSWPTPSGSNKVHIGIIQIGNRLYFIDLLAQVPSTAYLNGGDYITAEIPIDVNIAFTLYNGDVVGVSDSLGWPFLLSYDDVTDVVSLVDAPIKIRDTYGINDGLAIDERPTTLSEAHHYNLGNQGWTETIQTTCTDGAVAIQCTFDTIDVYPSNSDTWSLGKDADVSSADIDKYNPDLLKRNSVALGVAAKGHFIIDLYDRGASRVLLRGGDVELPVDRELGRISAVAAHAGRIFYSGIRSRVVGGDNNSPKLSSAVLFSQIARTNGDLVKCYQEADPTSPEQNDLVDTDGGILFISGASNIVKLLPVKQSLFVFAATGVWQIQGEDGGFKATSFQVQKVSSVGTTAQHSIIEANGTIFYWALGGIYALTPDQFGEAYESKNLTLTTIQSLYTSLPSLVKSNAKGFYDEDENIIRWMYTSDEDKIVGDPIDIQPDDPEVFQIGDPAVVEALMLEPKVLSLSTTRAIVVYRNATATNIRAVIVTLDPTTLETTVGSQVSLVTSTGLGGMSLDLLGTDRVLLTYVQNTNITSRVLNISDDSIVTATAYVVNTAHSSGAYTAPIRSELVSTGDVIITGISTSGLAGFVQVLQIDSSDVVTFGAVDLSVDVNLRHSDIAMLSPTAGVFLGDTTSSTRLVLETFTISGTTVTMSGVSNVFLNSTQMAGLGSYINSDSRINAINSLDVAVTTVATHLTPTVTSYMAQFTASVSGSTITSTSYLGQTTEIGVNPAMIVTGGRTATVYRKEDGGDFTGQLLYNSLTANPPTSISSTVLGVTTTFAHPELDDMGNNRVLIAYETDDNVEVIPGILV